MVTGLKILMPSIYFGSLGLSLFNWANLSINLSVPFLTALSIEYPPAMEIPVEIRLLKITKN